MFHPRQATIYFLFACADGCRAWFWIGIHWVTDALIEKSLTVWHQYNFTFWTFNKGCSWMLTCLQQFRWTVVESQYGWVAWTLLISSYEKGVSALRYNNEPILVQSYPWSPIVIPCYIIYQTYLVIHSWVCPYCGWSKMSSNGREGIHDSMMIHNNVITKGNNHPRITNES